MLSSNWSFKLVVTKADIVRDSEFGACEKQADGALSLEHLFGAGLAVSFGSFYVTVPTATNLVEGVFEMPLSLRNALQMREKVAMEIIDREIAQSLRNAAANIGLSDKDISRYARILLSEVVR